jgi:hypothetical protein
LLSTPAHLRQVRYEALMGWKWLHPHLKQIRPEVLPEEAVATTLDERQFDAIAPPGIQSFPSHYQQYPCVIGEPLNCAKALMAVWDDASTVVCPLCGFPAPLAEGATIGGKQGIYQVGRCLGMRGIGRLYEGVQQGAEQAVTIKEYLLPHRYFNTQDQQQRQDAFQNLAGLALADGRSQDLRVITPLEAITAAGEERCYLITPAENASPSLNVVLSRREPFSTREVLRVLDQVLQSLVCLHQQKFSLSPERQQVGIVHGNLHLDSLLWVVQGNQGFVYLTDLKFWEFPFDPVTVDMPSFQERDDLVALGHVAFYLLAGRTTDERGQRLNPKLSHQWPGVYPPLQQFILRLLAVEVPFDSAEAARQALLKVPLPAVQSELAPASEKLAPRRPWWFYGLIALAIATGLGALGGLTWWLLRPRSVEADNTPSLCCFEEVGAVPPGEFVYTGVDGGVWEQILEVEPLAPDALSLPQQLQVDQPDVSLTYRPADSMTAALEAVRSGQAMFAVLPLLENLPPEFGEAIIAYDGLAIVVAFNYAGRSQGLPQSLQGSIRLEDVRSLYGGRWETWQEVPGSRARLPVRLYAPAVPASLDSFDRLVLEGDGPLAEAIAFLEVIPMLRAIIRDFERDRVGGVGFAALSEVVGQCSVYPLAVGIPGRAPVQPFALASGEPITPEIDLCRRKGSYGLSAEALRSQSYPLAYPLAIVYARDNRRPPIGQKFAELMLTAEGQQYLQQFGLVPGNEPAE